MEAIDWKNQVESLVATTNLPVFSPIAEEFIQAFSAAILKDQSLKKYPEVISLGYWLRKSNIQKIKQAFSDKNKHSLVVSRGVALVYAPANIDTIFVYTWVISLLAGNATIIRVSNRQSEQFKILINSINLLLSSSIYNEIRKRILIIHYPHDQLITEWLSQRCHIRVIWGGDNTIQMIRQSMLAPIATEMVFPDRTACSMICATAIKDLKENEMIRLAEKFFNDTLFFHQKACSSPKLVVWVGTDEDIYIAKNRFWQYFQQIIKKKEYALASANHMERLTLGFYYATLKQVKEISNHDFELPLRILVGKLDSPLREANRGTGLFLEYHTEHISELSSLLQDKDQTITYFGFTKAQLGEFAQSLSGRKVDRIVPIGQALDFSSIWDGYDMLSYFTREIQLNV
ncbi:hypothetical protein BHU72_00305 [Desulfuribacillus stibiiarsenatis]|uniref:Long-chain-fatty-acyl-CoA reductase n=2 Tax=Desulfuribacillus stibiiarsenatis TaxID=1390249 RepID=A0A1E5LAD5_9FIRM|nr:hypothetical protein BHU72_00305 [Desulfuribacillus stibiiarsenatis]